MLVLNFSHPLTEEQRVQIEALAQTQVEEVRTIPVQIDQNASLPTRLSLSLMPPGFRPRSGRRVHSLSIHRDMLQPPLSYLQNCMHAWAISRHCSVCVPNTEPQQPMK